ncbi:MAG: thermonuclease family protein [Xanthobacteraceae bacterium]|nr:thermonuclease family protein [Xanthobacteraceae bacterium]
MRRRFCSVDRTAMALMRVATAVFAVVAAAPGWAADLQVTDGDTLVLDGITYRLEGIEAPQTDQTCLDDKGATWTCGIEARDRLRDYAGKGEVRCTDRGPDGLYGKRRIGECRVAGESISISQWLVQEGWALNAGARSRFKSDRESATVNRKGLWKGCFVSPEALRRFTISTASLLGAACPPPNNWKIRQTLFPDAPAMPSDCAIKGRMNLRSQATGYRGIYHLPSCRSYERTKTPHRWFCSEQEALAEGYRKSFTC